ncbi:tail fiber protein [Vibrio splendidus]|uniref:tail fiber protein n=1 Tax=Vibrio splendidus TaxID=29497 RepID=UPI00076AD67E|nr:tail fiber protein [Vibrio splendidus]PHX05504.1 Phage Tail Collar Domain protein [Vibrio splendidus]
MATRWYRKGTITATKGSKELVGSHTYWKDDAVKPLAGDIVIVSGEIHEIDYITDNNHLTLINSFEGTPPPNGEYAVIRNVSLNLTTRTAAMVAQLVNGKQSLFDQVHEFYTSNAPLINFDLGNGQTIGVEPIKQVEANINKLAASVIAASKNEIKILNATTLQAGSQATVTWDRSTGTVTLGIPKGDPGIKGDPGKNSTGTGTGTGTSTGVEIGKSDLDLKGHKILNLLAGNDTGQAVNYDQLDDVLDKIKKLERAISDSRPSVAPTPLNLGMWSGSDLQNNGGFTQGDGNLFRAYAYNDDGIKSFDSLERMLNKFDWVWAYSQDVNTYPVEMFKLSEISYDIATNQLSFVTEGNPNWQGGPISMYFIPMPKPSSGGGSGGDGNPVGSYTLIDGSDADPKNYLYCGGEAISRNAYSDLYSKIGVKYGVGDGKDTFNIPSQEVLPVAPYGAPRQLGYDKGERIKGIAINTKTQDIFVIGTIGSDTKTLDVFKQAGGVGPWISQGYVGLAYPKAIAVNEFNGDLWVADTFLKSEIFKKSAGGNWESQHYKTDGGKHADSIAVNQKNGDVWVTDQNKAEVFKLANGASAWVSEGYATQNASKTIIPTGVNIDRLTGDVYVIDKKEGRLSIKRGGVGQWEQEDTFKKDSAQVSISVNPRTKDVFLMLYTSSVLYLRKNGQGKFIAIKDTNHNLDSTGVVVDHTTGNIYFAGTQASPHDSDVYKLFGVPQWFVKAK